MPIPNTLTFSPSSNGWTSFWSYNPDWMLGLNSSFYTWKDGELYKHDSNNIRNKFYGSNYESKITTVFNQDPTQNKVFKTLDLESTHPWSATFTTDLSNGFNDASYFLEKEGSWMAYIRSVAGTNDNHELYTQGLGQVLGLTPPNTIELASVDSNISVGDQLYVYNTVINTLTLIGAVISSTDTSVTFSLITSPALGDYIVYIKNNLAESFGLRGYYMQVELSILESSPVELFEASSSVFKSYP